MSTSENGTQENGEEMLVCSVEELQAYFSGNTPASKIPSDLPQWKQGLLKKKEKEKLEKHKEAMTKLYEESQVPEWMRPLKALHQRRKSEQSEKEDAEKRKEEDEKQRFEAMPAWKKQLIYKKRAKSADNLLNRHQEQNNEPELSSECTATENTHAVENNEEHQVDGDVNGIPCNEEQDEETINDGLETSVQEREDELDESELGDYGVQTEDLEKKEGEETTDVGDQTENFEKKEETTDVGDQTEDLEKKGEEVAEVGDKSDEARDDENGDDEAKADISNKDDHDDNGKETSDKEDDQLILDDEENEDESRENDTENTK